MESFVCGTLAPNTFDDVQLAVVSALRSQKQDAIGLQYGAAWPTGRTPIVLAAHDFGTNRIHPKAVSPPAGAILYDLEQPTEEYVAAIVKAAQMFAARTVWCFSLEMTARLRDLRINSTHVPFGCVPEMKRLRKRADEDIDVFFYGLKAGDCSDDRSCETSTSTMGNFEAECRVSDREWQSCRCPSVVQAMLPSSMR